MSDISKCEGTDCPKRNECRRYTAVANEYWQAYLGTVPYDKETGDCEFFWQDYKDDKSKKA